MGGVETVLIGLLPLQLLPGATLRCHHPIFWKALWAASGFLFVLALLHPGLASANGGSTRRILAGAAVYGAVAVAFWWLTTRRAAHTASLDGTSAPIGGEITDRALDVTPL